MAKDFYQLHYEYLEWVEDTAWALASEARPYSYEINCIRSDATNSSMVQSYKANVCEVTTLFRHVTAADLGIPLEGALAPPVQILNRVYSDVQLVPTSSTGEAARAILLKQLTAVGMRTWLCEGGHAKFRHIAIYIFSSDQGPDMVRCDKLIGVDVRGFTNVIKLRQWCLEHQLHLMVKRQVARLGAYWSCLAKLIHCWRTWAKVMHSTWTP